MSVTELSDCVSVTKLSDCVSVTKSSLYLQNLFLLLLLLLLFLFLCFYMSVPFCGAGFVIPDLNVQKSFYLGKRFSIFTSELYAILMALNYICSIYFLDLC